MSSEIRNKKGKENKKQVEKKSWYCIPCIMDKFCVRMSEMILKSENDLLLVSEKKHFSRLPRIPERLPGGVNIQDVGIIGKRVRGEGMKPFKFRGSLYNNEA